MGYLNSGGTITYTDHDGLNSTTAAPYEDGYVVHTFLHAQSGESFVCGKAGNVRILIVAGGGGGGSNVGGGGGAGGYRYNTSVAVTSQEYIITVGDGGNGAIVASNAGSTGEDSSIAALLVVKGGGGGAGYSEAAKDGGSGGGGSSGQTNSGESVDLYQGRNGGMGGIGLTGGGGGGATTAGNDAITHYAGDGGVGTGYTISGSSVTYCGGGGGGGYYYAPYWDFAGNATYGGGVGSSISGGKGGNAADNRGGGGGGGGGDSGLGGKGGSGVVIIRALYADFIQASPINYFKKFVLGRAPTYFSYSFPFFFSTDGSGIGLKSTYSSMFLIKQLFSEKIGLYVDPLSMWDYIKNGVRLVIRELITAIGVALPTQGILHFGRILNTSMGLLPEYLHKVVFNYQISTKIGIITNTLVNIGKTLSTSLGIYTRGFWSRYLYNKTVVINPSTDGALSSYPIKLTIHRTVGTDTTSDVYVGTDCSFDYSDIDFTTTNGVYLEYWVESYTASSAVVWIKVTNIPASPTTISIIFYYGSTLVYTRNSGINTFTFFDDFSAGLSKWTTDSGCSVVGEELIVQSTAAVTKKAYSNTSFGTNHALRARLKSAHINVSANVIEDASISDYSDGHGVGASYCSYYSAYNNNYYNQSIDGRTYLPVSGWSADTYHIQDMIRNGSTNNTFYVDNANLVTVTDTLDTDSHPIRFFTTNNTAKLTIDWVLIRPYTANEPTFGTWGSKITTAGSPFKNYLLKVYRGLSAEVGVVATKIAGIGYKFTLIKVGLTSAISSTTVIIKSFINKIGAKSSFIYSLSFNRFLNTSVGFSLWCYTGFLRSLTTSLGLLPEVYKTASYNFRTSIGLISNYFITKGVKLVLSTSIGIMGFSVNKISLYVRYLTTKLGLTAIQGTNRITKVFVSSIGLAANYVLILKTYFSFITYTGLVATTIRQYSVFKDLSIKAGLIATEAYRGLGIALTASIGLTAHYLKDLAYYLNTFIGIVSTLNRQISIQRILQKALGISFVKDTKAAFEEVLSTTFGLISDLWYKAGGRVRYFATSFGLVSSLSNTNGYYREIISNIGFVATRFYNSAIIRSLIISIGVLGTISRNIVINRIIISIVGVTSLLSRNLNSFMILSSSLGMVSIKHLKVGVYFVVKVGLVASRGIIRWAGALVTKIGLVGIVDRHRHDFETFTISIGLKITNISSKWFGKKRFKSLKFFDPKTSDNKKLRIKK